MNHPVLWTIADWANAIVALPAEGSLPQRTVLVPSERHAHALRRALVRAGQAPSLAGTRFLTPLAAAEAVLGNAGVPFVAGEDLLRRLRLGVLLKNDALALESFDRAVLRQTRGWEGALASAVTELEAALLAPCDLPQDLPRSRDLALLWVALDREAGTSFTRGRVFREAAAVLARSPEVWPHRGPVLAVATGHEAGAEARFLCALPSCTLALQAASPRRGEHLRRVSQLYGDAARAALAGAALPADGGTERDLLARHLFGELGAAGSGRRRSTGPDGTVSLEEHAGADEELEAAVDWVAEEILERGTPLAELAVLVPSLDPHAALLAARLERLPWPGGTLPIHVAGGLPATCGAAGARTLAVLRALEDHLPAQAIASVLPSLRCGGERRHLSIGEAMELAYALGTAGGQGANPAGALEWAVRAVEREAELTAALARASASLDGGGHERRRIEGTLSSLRAVRPALLSLVQVARAVMEEKPLEEVWAALRTFLRDSLLSPGEGPSIADRLHGALGPLCATGAAAGVTGRAALDLVGEVLASLRDAPPRFGLPAVYVGTLASASGLHFSAVRAMGLCEGTLPRMPREDPALPGPLRERLAVAGAMLRTPGLCAAGDLQGLHRAVLGASRVVLSAPRADLARTEREPSSAFIEAAAALGRPDEASGAPGKAVPGLEDIRRDAFAPARSARARWRTASPVGASAWLDRIAAGERALPPAWTEDPALELARLQAPGTGALGAFDGVLDPASPFPPIPGLDPARPISASGLADLLHCPRRFLQAKILGWIEPAGSPELHELDALTYGTLFHAAAETFYREHGPAFLAHEGTFAAWEKAADAVAVHALRELMAGRPLVGEGPRARELRRLQVDLRSFLRHDWSGPKGRRLHGVELGFGDGPPLLLDLGDGVQLHVHGRIDRIDVEDGVTFVRDLKTGKSHPRVKGEAEPVPGRDAQLGLYVLVISQLARAWGLPPRVEAAYAYAGARDAPERAFRDDADSLADAAREWFRLSFRLVGARAFPPSPDAEDCQWCAFTPVCGPATPRRASEALAEAKGALGELRDLKGTP